MHDRRDGRPSRGIAALAVIALGISAGAMLTEAAVLVPYWRSLPAEDFLRWFSDNEPRLVAFYGPVEMTAAALAVLAAVVYAARGHPGTGLLALAALLVVGVLALYPIYFRAANGRFVTGAIDGAGVAAELARWSAWQWLRVAMGIGALLAAVAALFSERA